MKLLSLIKLAQFKILYWDAEKVNIIILRLRSGNYSRIVAHLSSLFRES